MKGVPVEPRAARSEPEDDVAGRDVAAVDDRALLDHADGESGEIVFALRVHSRHLGGLTADEGAAGFADRKSTRLNSSHGYISYAVFCLKKKNKIKTQKGISARDPISG